MNVKELIYKLNALPDSVKSLEVVFGYGAIPGFQEQFSDGDIVFTTNFTNVVVISYMDRGQKSFTYTYSPNDGKEDTLEREESKGRKDSRSVPMSENADSVE